MNYQFPKEYKASKEEEKTSERLNTRAKAMATNFLKGLFFFITVPISIYNKIKRRKKQ